MTETSSRSLDELRHEAQYARERFELYQAKVYGPRATSLGRLRELERAWRSAQERADRAEGGLEPVVSA